MSLIRNMVTKSYKDDRPLNILSEFFDGHFEYNLAKLGHHIYGDPNKNLLNWTMPYSKRPDNIHFSPEVFAASGYAMPFDLLLCHNRLNAKFYQTFSLGLHIPVIMVDHLHVPLEHVAVHQHKVVATHESLKLVETAEVVHYGIDIPELLDERTVDVLIADSLPSTDHDILSTILVKHGDKCLIMGDNKEISEPKLDNEYENAFLNSKVYLNLSANTSISHNLLKAMAAGCAIVSNRTDTLTNALEDSASFIKSRLEIENIVRELLNNPKKLKEQGGAARKLATEQFGMDNFLTNWERILQEARYKVFTA